jgi:regulator of protease activity HflC (stomatin/prohibitin superfamily)
MKQIKSLILLALTMSVLSACSQIDPGVKGVRVTLGKASTEVLDSGAYPVFPFITHIRKISTQIQRSDVDASAASQDMQEVNTKIAVNWMVEPEQIVSIVNQFGDEDQLLERVIVPNVNEVLKQATSKKKVEEILSKRSELKEEIDKILAERLKKYGVTVKDVSLVNIHFSEEFTKSIEQKQIAEQEAKRAEYVAQKANKEADAAINKARGDAEAQKLLKATITQEVLQLRAIEKWNGQLPQVVGSGATPFIDLKTLSHK